MVAVAITLGQYNSYSFDDLSGLFDADPVILTQTSSVLSVEVDGFNVTLRGALDYNSAYNTVITSADVSYNGQSLISVTDFSLNLGALVDLEYEYQVFDLLEDQLSGHDTFISDLAEGLPLDLGAGNDFALLGAGDDTLFGGLGNDTLIGGGGDDDIVGGYGADTLLGGGGHDILIGGAGRDRLLGAAGADVLVAGRGRDVLIGGKGADDFVFSRNDGLNNIRDFGEGHDVIEITSGARGMNGLTFEQVDNDVLVTFAQTSILVKGWDAADLNDSDYFGF
ncbi:calcium-binding protein [Arenibacterium sp. LLYu02]|uniref:calcium-binding protein n=1 Tax=Arenibacterium sp. LLYu02 TaxID=3404132 RepID=UPI003B2148CD